MDKKQSRIRRSRRTRAKIASLGVTRLCVHRTPRHTYAQVISGETGKVIVAASTLSADVRKAIKYPGNVEAATAVGKVIAEKAKAAGIESVAFDRSGFKYHGRVKALADSAREHGLKF
ncbi:MAG: 50S ribosomal protein L18 [Gammaproteobacteria bacterium]|nr:50S ribosomal protein L18 [Gammaproteobacteria bacterium]MDH3857770.1 50S ribosomal protein L18 [Gammaproteobacteria bacterium]